MFKKAKGNTHFWTNVFPFLSNAWNRAVDFIYPPCCPFCDKELKMSEKMAGVCVKCQEELVYITKPCMKCGKAVLTEREEYCYDCQRHKHYFDQARGILSYQKKTKVALYRFKASNRKEYARFFGKEICRLLGRWLYNCRGDYLIPIPMHSNSEGVRGYNQAMLLAKVISDETGIPLCENLLCKIVETKQQKDLGREERRHNLENTFVVAEEGRHFISGRIIILVDDIYTTGATVDAAAKLLKSAGAKNVFVVTVAIGG